MFTHLLIKDNNLLKASFSDYAKSHYLKRFEKDYKGLQWSVTVDSVFQDISRIKTHENDLKKHNKSLSFGIKIITGFLSMFQSCINKSIN